LTTPKHARTSRNKIIQALAPRPDADNLNALIARLKDEPCDVTLDGTQVKNLDQGSVQILAVLHKTQTIRAHRFKIKNPSEAFLKDAATYGFKAILFPREAT